MAHNPLVVMGPLPLYAAKPYAHLPASNQAVEYLPDRSTLRWLLESPRVLPKEWGLDRLSLPAPKGLRRFGPVLRPIARRLLPDAVKHARAVVITSPFQHSLAELLADKPLIYHVFDEYESYGWTDEVIGSREAAILRWARHVVVVSAALARLYRDKYAVPAARITVIPNGYEPMPTPPTAADLAAIRRPRIGTLGNVNERLRLDWALRILEAVPWATWTFVGGVTEEGPPPYKEALAALRRHPRCAFVGSRPYSELPAYAAAFDVAIFPFSDHILNRASSPTRFFSQVPYGQPILITGECEQLASLPPIVRICGSPDEFVAVLHELQQVGFSDGHEKDRAEFARGCTWAARAEQLHAMLESVAPLPHPTARRILEPTPS